MGYMGWAFIIGAAAALLHGVIGKYTGMTFWEWMWGVAIITTAVMLFLI